MSLIHRRLLITGVVVSAVLYSMVAVYVLRETSAATIKASEEVDVAFETEGRANEEVVEETSSQEIIGDKFLGEFIITAYDLSEQCCSKKRDNPAFGITNSGESILGKSREEAMAVAVDPNVIKLGSKLYIEFEGEYQEFSGVYTAIDTGSLIKKNKIDLLWKEEVRSKFVGFWN